MPRSARGASPAQRRWPGTDSGARQVAAEKVERELPRLLRRLGPVAFGVGEVEERVAGAREAMKLVWLAQARQLGVDPIDVGRRRVGVVEAEQSEHRTGDLRGEIERGALAAPWLHDVAAV